MQDIFHKWASDLEIGDSGDLRLTADADMVTQRICRRLITNPGHYIWHVDYGGGLAEFVGSPTDAKSIEALIRTQLSLETVIPATPSPQVKVALVNPATGFVQATILYSDPTTGSSVQLNVST